MKFTSAVLSVVLLSAAPASAAVDFFDSFESDVAQLNQSTFANFVVSDGTVDIVTNGSFGISCATGNQCVDLDGSTGDGGTLTTKNSYAFNAGDRVTLSIMLAGNFRGGDPDEFSFGFNTDTPIVFLDVVGQNTREPGFFSVGDLGPGTFLGSGRPFGSTPAVAPDEGYLPYSISFTAGGSGNLTAFVATASADDLGPSLDDFHLTITEVPEPASWAMMILGIGVIGGIARRKREPHPAFIA